MPTPVFLGDFEQLVLLTLLRLGDDATALDLRARIEDLADRSVSRGALYRTLDRMEDKGWVAWSVDEADVPERGGRPRRRFRVTDPGIEVLRDSRRTLRELWTGLEGVLG
ncbi:MAG: helix-turn-helix transcriptional regulator [Gemmatimonadota bacterium]